MSLARFVNEKSSMAKKQQQTKNFFVLRWKEMKIRVCQRLRSEFHWNWDDIDYIPGFETIIVNPKALDNFKAHKEAEEISQKTHRLFRSICFVKTSLKFSSRPLRFVYILNRNKLLWKISSNQQWIL